MKNVLIMQEKRFFKYNINVVNNAAIVYSCKQTRCK